MLCLSGFELYSRWVPLIIYRSFILPVLDYCNTVWNCCGRTNTDKKNYRDVRQGLSMQTNSSDEALAHLKYHKLGLRREIHALNLSE